MVFVAAVLIKPPSGCNNINLTSDACNVHTEKTYCTVNHSKLDKITMMSVMPGGLRDCCHSGGGYMRDVGRDGL